MQEFYYWTAKFAAPPPETYSFSKGRKGERDGATATTIRKVLREKPSGVPVFIYVGLHTELYGKNENRFFIPANRPGDLSGPDPRRMISYDEFSKLLSASSSPSPMALLTESCYSDNLMRLPFKYSVERVDGVLRMRQEETGFSGKDERELKPLVAHFAATTPDKRAACYKIGAVYTQAFFKDAVREAQGFEDMMIKIQESMDTTFEQNKSREGPQLSQQHVVYTSRIIQKDEDIWSALEFDLKAPIAAEPDRESEGCARATSANIT